MKIGDIGLVEFNKNPALTAKARLVNIHLRTVCVEILQGILDYRVGEQVVVATSQFTVRKDLTDET